MTAKTTFERVMTFGADRGEVTAHARRNTDEKGVVTYFAGVSSKIMILSSVPHGYARDLAVALMTACEAAERMRDELRAEDGLQENAPS
jgi:hypothetical protein